MLEPLCGGIGHGRSGGTDYNDIAIGEISQIVDVSDVPLIDYVTNTEATAGGGDREDDEAYRERIREAENRLSTAGRPKPTNTGP